MAPNGQDAPSCISSGSYDKDFIEPPAGTECRAGETCLIGWSGGKTNDRNSQTDWRGYVVDTHYGYPEYKNVTIFDRKTFRFGDSGWINKDVCSNTQMRYDWTIPANLTPTAANYRYILIRESVGLYNNIGYNPSSSTVSVRTTLTGPYFLVMPATTTMSSDTTTSITGAAKTSPDPTSDPTSEPRPGTEMSTGAKVGLGIGTSLGLICLLTGLFLWARRFGRRNTKRSATAESQTRYDKAEMDSGTLEKTFKQQRVPEVGGAPLSELTAQPVQAKSPTPHQQLFELPGTERGS